MLSNTPMMWSQNPQQYTALVVDSNPHMMTIIRRFLHQCGLRGVIPATTIAEAMDFIAKVPVDVIFCDLGVKPKGGIEFLRLLRNPTGSHNIKIPVIMMAEGASAQMVYEARDKGANEFLAKPLALKGVERVLKATLEKPRDFVESDVYVGPDRRRRQMDVGNDRRGGADDEQPDYQQDDPENPGSEPDNRLQASQ